MSDERTLYELLGVERTADAAQISRAWRKRTRKAGPGSPEFTRLNEAAETLLNPDRRAAYDATLPQQAPVGAVNLTKATPEAPEEAAPQDAASATAGRRTPLLVGLAILTALTVAAVVLAVVAVDHKHRDDQIDSARTQALAAARQAMGVVLAYNYTSMDADLQRDLNYLTPSFGKEFSRNFALLTDASGGAKSPAQQTKTIVTVAVKGAAIMDAEPDRAHVLVFADQTTVHKAGPRKQACPCVLANRVQVSMVKQHGTWLVDDLRTS